MQEKSYNTLMIGDLCLSKLAGVVVFGVEKGGYWEWEREATDVGGSESKDAA